MHDGETVPNAWSRIVLVNGATEVHIEHFQSVPGVCKLIQERKINDLLPEMKCLHKIPYPASEC